MKIGLAQINPTVGDLDGNARLILEAYEKLVAEGAELVLFPELALPGYPPRDLLFKSRFVPDTEEKLATLAEQIGTIPALVGTVLRREGGRGRSLWNAVAWCEAGELKRTIGKTLLPTYDVFDEDRYFESADGPEVVEFQGKRLGITICEDIWTGPVVETSKHYHKDPLAQLAGMQIDFLLNLSASPWHFGKMSSREAIVREAARRVGCPAFYCNAVGGNDELIFDGHSLAVTHEGRLLAGLAGFAEDMAVVDSEALPGSSHPTFSLEPMADVHRALTLGIRDYAYKSGFKQALVGLSGGIDSAVTAVLAADALGPENVLGVSLPSEISSQHSRDDASTLAENLGIEFMTLPIAEVVKGVEATLAQRFSGREPDVTEENIQARARGLLLMAISNKEFRLLLTTGNKSEVAVGYCTLYGDMAGGLAVISDVLKTQVFALARWMNRDGERVPENTITKPPSAELRPDQKDEDSLPPYETLDEILRLYVEEGISSRDIVIRGFEREVVRDVVRKVDLNEYKRKQAAPGLKITPLAFGVGRRIPIVQKYVG